MAADETPRIPINGPPAPGMQAYDRLFPELMRKYDVPGCAIAVAKDGRLVLARGYGLADVEADQPVQPDALFRIASLSKPITAAAVLALVERGRLSLDDKALDRLGSIEPVEGDSMDPRFAQITIRHLLQHTAGFDRGASFDPMFQPKRIALHVGVEPPAGPEAVVRFMLGRPLDFDPGGRYVYSNLGYCILGRIIEEVTGETYEQAVRQLVLEPAGISRMRLGRTRLEHRAPHEVRYYGLPGEATVQSVFPGVEQLVAVPYGRFHLEAMDAHGAWLASAVDLVRFATTVSGGRGDGCVLKAETAQLIVEEAVPQNATDPTLTYGLGWAVRHVDGGTNWFHAGSLPGTRSLLVRTHHGLTWAAVVNRRPRNQNDFGQELDRTLWKAAAQVTAWPDGDLFEQFP